MPFDFLIPKYNAVFESSDSLRYFDNKKIRYLWNFENLEFEKLYGLDRNVVCSAFYQQNGLTADEQLKRLYKKVCFKNILNIKIENITEPNFLEKIQLRLKCNQFWKYSFMKFWVHFIFFKPLLSFCGQSTSITITHLLFCLCLLYRSYRVLFRSVVIRKN